MATSDKTALLVLAQTLTNKTIDADNNTISNLEHGNEVDEPSSGVHGVTGSLVGTSDTQTLTNKTLTSPVINTQITGTAVLDEDDMNSDSNVRVPTQQSVKKYVDNILDGTTPFSAIDVNGNADISGTLNIGSSTTRIVAPSGTFVNNENGNPNMSDTSFNVISGIAEDTFETIGPTDGAGANDWSALDLVPTDASWVKIRFSVYGESSTGTPDAGCTFRIHATSGASSEAIGSNNLVASAVATVGPNGDCIDETTTEHTIPISSGRLIRLAWENSNFQSAVCTVQLVGFGINPTS